jgi:hypothetical protein
LIKLAAPVNTIFALTSAAPASADQNGIDRVIMETVTNSNGTLSFCPVSVGTYDVVISAYKAGVVYAAIACS